MSQQLQMYQPAPLGDPTAELASMADPGSGGGTNLLHSLGRRWKLIILVWLLTVGPAVAAVWYFVKPDYTATALIQVAPVLTPVLYEDQDTRQALPLYESYLKTIAQRVNEQTVLLSALSDPAVKGLPLLKYADPLAELRENLTVESLRGTHLVAINVKDKSPEHAIAMARAILRAFMAGVVDRERRAEQDRRNVLEANQNVLKGKLDRLRAEIRELAKGYETDAESTFELLRRNVEEASLKGRQELEAARNEQARIRQRIENVEKGVLIDDLPMETADRNVNTRLTWEQVREQLREQRIEGDPAVISLKESLKTATAKLEDLRPQRRPAHEDLIQTEKQIERLRGELDKARKRAAELADKEIEAKRQQRLEEQKVRLKDSLAAMERLCASIEARVKEHEEKGKAIGRLALEIQALRDEIKRTEEENAKVAEALRKDAVESQRPARVTEASDAEIRPEGIKDRRTQAIPGAIAGTLALACAVAFIRDRLDPRVHSTDQVQAASHLRLLGEVPSLSDLKAGRVTQEQFVESYRVIRAALAGAAMGAPPRSILVTSAQAAEGKTSLAVSLAISFAESGERTLLIDADIQAPQVGRLLKLTPPGELKRVLLGEQTLAQAVAPTAIAGLDVLAAIKNGDATRAALNTRTAAALIRDAAGTYDHIVIDSPPSLGAADALVWAQAVDGVLISSLIGRSDGHAMGLACHQLCAAGARLLGAVAANVSVGDGAYSYSTSGYRVDAEGERRKRRGGKPRAPAVVRLSLPDESGKRK